MAEVGDSGENKQGNIGEWMRSLENINARLGGNLFFVVGTGEHQMFVFPTPNVRRSDEQIDSQLTEKEGHLLSGYSGKPLKALPPDISEFLIVTREGDYLLQGMGELDSLHEQMQSLDKPSNIIPFKKRSSDNNTFSEGFSNRIETSKVFGIKFPGEDAILFTVEGKEYRTPDSKRALRLVRATPDKADEILRLNERRAADLTSKTLA